MSLLDSASLIVTPNGYSENTIYSVIPSSGAGDFTFTRATDAWRTNSQGLVQRVAWNLVQYSEQFNNGIWSKSRTSVLPNTAISPDGDLTATTLIEDTSNATHRVFQSVSKSSTPIQYTFSCYLKAKERTFAQIRIAENGELDSASAVINLSTGQLIGTYGTYSNVSGSVVSLNNGWYRLSITVTSVNASSIIGFILPALNGDLASPSYLGNGTSGIYIWGAQLVEGSSALEYFPTTDRQDVPRIDYSLGGCPNILLEPQRTNLALHSEDLTQAVWTKGSGVTITADNAISPSGIQNADRVTGATGPALWASPNTLSQQIGVFASSTLCTITIYLRSSTTSSQVTLVLRDQSTGFVSSVVCNLTSSWQRFEISRTTGAATTALGVVLGAATADFFAWGLQGEAGAYATTYIPTTSASVTRNADVITRSNVFTNGFITASGGTWFLDLKNSIARTRDTFAQSIFIGNSSSGVGANGFAFTYAASMSRIQIRKYVSAVETVIYTTTVDNPKIAIKWNGTTADIFQNGVKVISSTAFTGTNIEWLVAQAQDVPKYINSMMLFPTPLSDSDLQLLTGDSFDSYAAMAAYFNYTLQ
jgi:hypothetical protein